MDEGDGRAARRIAREDIERVDPCGASAVMAALRTGRAVRLRFSADRPVIERDTFIARVRTIMVEPAVTTYPAAETSGVRVALREEGTEIEEEATVAGPLARARRG